MALMSVEQLLDQAEDEYMSVDQLAFFKDRLEVKAAELRDRLLSCQASCEIERHPDEADFASDEENRAVAASMIERDRQTLSHVLKARKTPATGPRVVVLGRIDAGAGNERDAPTSSDLAKPPQRSDPGELR
ncbi:dnaK suppressor protein [Pseudomonas syringae pv. actinidiae ICMP 19071]|nr:dnaK suppressor protein [Pseudomonas syringae pv. actinidiae ICMP 19071]